MNEVALPTQWPQLNPHAVRALIKEFEKSMAQFDELEIPPKHIFMPGVYLREITIPAGALVSGRIHKYESASIMSAGDISILTEHGLRRIKAPFSTLAGSGIKRFAYAHTETVWTAIHPNPADERDIEKLEAYLFANDYDEILGDVCQVSL